MSWLGQNGASREDFYALADAYKAVYNRQELNEDPETIEEADKKGDSVQADTGGTAEWRATENTADPDAGPGGAPKVEKKDSPSVKKQLDAAGKRKKPDAGEIAKMKNMLPPDAFKVWKKEHGISESVQKEESELLADLADAYAMMYEKKKDSDKCGDGTYWDKEEKKCKSKKKKSGTTVVVGRGGIYGPGYHGGGSGSNGGGDTDTDGGDTDGGGGDGGGGGGE